MIQNFRKITASFLCVVMLLTSCGRNTDSLESLQSNLPEEPKLDISSETPTVPPTEISTEPHTEPQTDTPDEIEQTAYIFNQDAFQNPDVLLATIDEHAGRVDLFLTLDSSFFTAMQSALSQKYDDRYDSEYWRRIFDVDYSEDVTCSLAERIEVKADDPIGCVVHILAGHLDIYLLYTKLPTGGESDYELTGLVCTNEKTTSVYRVETFGNEFWLVVQVENNRGTGISIFNEIWYDSMGNEVLCIQNEGHTLLFARSNEDEWYSGEVYFDSVIEKQDDNKGFTLTTRISADFRYNEKPVYHSDEIIAYRYDTEIKAFVFIPEVSTLKPSLQLREDKGYQCDNSLLAKYDYRDDYENTEQPPNEEEWVEILKNK